MGIPEMGGAETRSYRIGNRTGRVVLNADLLFRLGEISNKTASGQYSETEGSAALVNAVFGEDARNISWRDAEAALKFAMEVHREFFPADKDGEDADPKNGEAEADKSSDLGQPTESSKSPSPSASSAD